MQDRKDTQNTKVFDSIVAGIPVTDANVNKNNAIVAPSNQNQDQNNQNNQNQNNQTTIATNNSGLTDPTGNAYTTTPPEGYSYKLPQVKEGERFVFDKNGKPFIDDGKGNLREDPTLSQEYSAMAEKNKQIKANEESYRQTMATLDIEHQNIVNRIMTKAKEKRTKTEDLNKRMMALKQMAGYRTGGAEYTSEINSGILEKTEADGLARLKDIDNEEAMLIAEAKVAKSKDDRERLEKKMEQINKLNDQKLDTIKEIYKAYADNEKAIRDKEKELKAEERAVKDQSLQEIKISAPNLYKAYDSLKTTAEKNVFLEKLVAKTGLDTSVIMGSMDTAREDVKKEKAGSKPTEGELNRSAISGMTSSMDKTTGIDGYVSPEQWLNFRRSWLKKSGLQIEDFNKNFKIYLNPESYSTVGLE